MEKSNESLRHDLNSLSCEKDSAVKYYEHIITELQATIDNLELNKKKLQITLAEEIQTVKTLREGLEKISQVSEFNPISPPMPATPSVKLLIDMQKTLELEIGSPSTYDRLISVVSPPSSPIDIFLLPPPPSPSIKLLMELHESLDLELQKTADLEFNFKKIDLQLSEDDNDSSFDRNELNNSLSNLDQSYADAIWSREELEDRIREKDRSLINQGDLIVSLKKSITVLENSLEERNKKIKEFEKLALNMKDESHNDTIYRIDGSWIVNENEHKKEYEIPQMQISIKELTDKNTSLASLLSANQQALVDSQNALESQKEVFKYKEKIELERSHDKMKQQGQHFQDLIRQHQEEKVKMISEIMNYKNMCASALSSIDTINSIPVDNVGSILNVKKELLALQIHMNSLDSKKTDTEKHSRLIHTYTSPVTAERAIIQSSRKKPSSTLRRPLTESEALIQTAVRSSHDGTHWGLETPDTGKVLKSHNEQDCTGALGCTPS